MLVYNPSILELCSGSLLIDDGSKTIILSHLLSEVVTRVQEYINDRLKSGPIHVTLIDPDKQEPMIAAERVQEAEIGGTHIILVGGTIGVDHPKLETTLEAVGKVTNLPIVLFPAEARVISGNADAILFMSLLNSKNVRYVMMKQAGQRK